MAGGVGYLTIQGSLPVFGKPLEQQVDPIGLARRSRIFVLEHGKFWDIKKVVKILLQANADAIRCDVGIFSGLVTMYQSQYLPHHPELGDRDPLRDLLTECKKYAIKVYPYNAFYHHLSAETSERFPDWAMRKQDGSRLEYACQNNPDFVSTYAAACKEIVQNYDVAGMYFDGPGELPNSRISTGLVKHQYCYCEFCKKAFYDRYHSPMPIESDVENDPVLRTRMLTTHMRGMEFITSETCKAIKSVRNIPVIMNACDPVKRFIRHSSVEYTDGALMAEIARDSTYMEALARTKIGAAFAKASWCYCPIGPHEELVSYDDLETELFGLLYLSHGGTPLIETMQSYFYDPRGIASVNRLLSHMQKNEDLYSAFTPVPFIALHSSDQTARWFSSLDRNTRSGHWDNRYFCGAFAALTHAHQQFEVILDGHVDLQKLSRYRALLLANTACLSDSQVEAIRQFVRNGGGLIATQHTSLRDENGNLRSDFALTDLFKVSYQHEQEARPGRLGDGDPYLFIEHNHPIFEGLESSKFIYCEKQPYPIVNVLEGGSVIAKMYIKNVGESFAPIQFSEVRDAGIVVSTFGKGRVVYIAPPLDYIYGQREFHDVRQIVSNAINWITLNETPLKTSAPICVTANLTERCNQRALHLINYTGNRQEKFKSKLEWVATLQDVEIGLRQVPGKKLARVSTIMQTGSVPFISNRGYDHLNLPLLEKYEALMLDYEPIVQ